VKEYFLVGECGKRISLLLAKKAKELKGCQRKRQKSSSIFGENKDRISLF